MAPAGSTTGSAKQRADVVIGPYGMRGEPHRPPTPAERLCQRLQGIGEGRSGNHPLMSINFGQSLSHGLRPCQLPLHKGAFGTGDADCRVASLLAMTVLILCHSEEAQRADVGIRPFYDGRGFRPPYLGHGLRRPNFVPKFGASVRSSAPTEGLLKSQQRADVVIGPYGMKRKPAATAEAALSEAESAERVAGQIQSLPDTLRVQHGVQRSEVSVKPRPCSRRGCVD